MPSAIQPPLVATWLVNLFTPGEEGESIQGDLLEEFSDVASQSGVASARQWYWRHGLKTIAHLIAAGFRDSPWLIICAVLGGYLLLQVSLTHVEQAVVAILRTQRPYSGAHVRAYMLFLDNGIRIGHILVPLLVGCIVALAAKGREMLTTIALGLLRWALNAVRLLVFATALRTPHMLLLRLLVMQCTSLIAIALGGIIVREMRMAALRRRSRA